MTLVVASYNIHAGIGNDGIYDLFRIAQTLQREKPDIVCLQEVHEYTTSAPESQTQLIAHALELPHTMFVPTMTGSPRAQNYIGWYGNAICSKYPFQLLGVLQLNKPGSGEPRNACVVAVDTPYGSLKVLAVHLPLDLTMRQQRRAIHKMLKWETATNADIICGDFNTLSCCLTPMQRDWMDCWLVAGCTDNRSNDDNCHKACCSYSDGCTHAWRRIDYIFASKKSIVPVTMRVLKHSHASDHFAIACKFYLRAIRTLTHDNTIVNTNNTNTTTK